MREALRFAARRSAPVFILGGGSNVVFRDDGFDGLVLRVAAGGLTFSAGEVVAGAGVEWDRVVQGAVERGWAGIECLSGIPGGAGGTPIQNVGAYGQEISATLTRVACLDRHTLERRDLSPDDCRFGYRTSAFKTTDRDRYVVLEVAFALEPGGPPRLEYPELLGAVARAGGLDGLDASAALARVRCEVLALRRGKAMVLDPEDPNTRSVGSFFTNPVLSAAEFAELERRSQALGLGRVPSFAAAGGHKVPAAWLIERAGFAKGYRRGGAGISTRHALALVNFGGTSAELLALAEAITAAVAERFGVRLVPEPEIVGAQVRSPKHLSNSR